MSRSRNLVSVVLVLAAVPAFAQQSHTVLTFGGLTNGPVDQAYGDNVTASTMGSFTYGGGGNFTPNVTVSYAQDLPGDPFFSITGFAGHGYSGMTRCVHSAADGWDITLTALAGINVILRGFDMGDSGGGNTISSVVVTDATTASVLFSQSNVAVPGFFSPHLSFDFTPLLAAESIRIRFDMTGLGAAANDIGVDNIEFSQGANNVVAQANRSSSSLQINGTGAFGILGPHIVSLGGSSTLTFDWAGPAGQPLVLMTGPLHPTGTNFGSCIGTMHLGDPMILFSDVVLLFNGLEPTFPNSVFVLDAAGSAQQSFTLPAGLSGTSSMQGVVFQGPSAPCDLALTAAFVINWQ